MIVLLTPIVNYNILNQECHINTDTNTYDRCKQYAKTDCSSKDCVL